MIRATHSILAAVAAVAVAAAGPTAAAQQTVAESSLLQLDVTAVPQAGVGGFSGELGAVSAGPGNDIASWDQSDPEGVRSHVNGWHGGPTPPGTSTVQVTDSAGSREASAAWSGFGISATEGGPNLLSFGALHTWARCTQAPLASSEEAYAATDSNSIYLFDDTTRPLPAGRSAVETTGARMGLSGIGDVTLTIDVARIQETYAHGAHAAIRIQVHAVMRDTSGETVFDGGLMDVTAGEVSVECESAPPTSEPPTPEPPTSEPPTSSTESPEPPTSSTDTSEPPTSTTSPCPPPPSCDQESCPQPPPTCTEPPDCAENPGAPGCGEPPSGGGDLPGGEQPGDGSDGSSPGIDHLAQTGVPTGALSIAGAALLAAGALLLVVLRRKKV
ncbi:LPXTG-motif cell wall anchor domain-containing protein [Saccharopolyspora antimicrobica]|uniref:LPXTG-motif cell wall anchor domain-containing protein n=1 Tax=Saccharopolyspora antimicrobica TaxID=455193 RepID=A0A1I5GB84_9PSEU|nr:LPXTG cell wall anchor domain-containing protein [Saccharopolyspora antimicrobica]RKT83854.1 LPXTG-motif cell wall-anchored protein [Saccharopolyspora antimicrobica]SFO32781.1 LPXTG-motif cell wall anchor domain-containing protein [Saccharopolyspora antimicrobica]